jgi:hypothetical protein
MHADGLSYRPFARNVGLEPEHATLWSCDLIDRSVPARGNTAPGTLSGIAKRICICSIGDRVRHR